MSQNRVLNYCFVVSFTVHVFFLAYFFTFSAQIPAISTLPVELISFNKTSLNSYVPPSFSNSNSLAEASSPPSISQKRILSPLSGIEKNNVNYVRGGETTKHNLVLPLQSFDKQANFNVRFSDRNHNKIAPGFDVEGPDQVDDTLLFAEIIAADESSEVTAVKAALLTEQRGEKDYIAQYRTELLERVKSVVSYPGWARRKGVKGQVTLELLIERSGAVSDIQVFESSGDLRLDEEAVSSVASIDNFPAFPKDMAVSRAKVKIPVHYNLH